MTDRELLEFAAKAAGITISTWSNCQAGGFLALDCMPERRDRFWDPIIDDGDALQLMVKLGLLVDVWLQQKVCIASNQGEDLVGARVEFGTDHYAATRRAIVRAAAEIGRGME